MAGSELVPLAAIKNLPTPADFAKILRDWLDQEIDRVRKERGEVTAAEDTFAMVRALQRTREAFADYSRAFASVGNVAAQEIENELLDAVGEQEGIPLSSLNVPDTDGTVIKLSRNMPNSHSIDVDPLYSALAMRMLHTTDIQQDALEAATAMLLTEDQATATANLNEVLVRMLGLAMLELTKLGNFSAQVSKVRALSKELAVLGMDDLAAVVSKSVRTTKEYKGVSISREQPK